MQEYWRDLAVLAEVLPVPVDQAVLWFHRLISTISPSSKISGCVGPVFGRSSEYTEMSVGNCSWPCA